ncbi:MAG: hypothetical protein R8K48_08945 [Gallionella sp.]
MKNEAQRKVKFFFQFCVFAITVFFMANVSALVLGKIDVQSALGQPLNAHIAFLKFSESDARQLNIHIANVDDYRKLGLQYPYGYQFQFRLITEPSNPPFIRVSTQQVINDPFVILLVKITSQSASFFKNYTFLIDPSSRRPMSAVQPARPFVSAKADAQGVVTAKPVKHAIRHKHHHAKKSRAMRVKKRHGRLRMRLAMSLSISKYDPSVPIGSSRDALQDELTANVKQLEDMQSQVVALQRVITSLNEKHAQPVALVVESKASNAVRGKAQPKQVAPPVPLAGKPQVTSMNWLNILFAIIALLLIVLGSVMYRKNKLKQAHQQGMFDDLADDESPIIENTLKVPAYVDVEKTTSISVLDVPAPIKDVKTLPVGASSPASASSQCDALPFNEPTIPVAQVNRLIVPPEYAILMEANKFLRTGDKAQAEEALNRAIEVNPKNGYGYVALLKIYGERGERARFEALARKLKKIGSAASFAEVAQIGRQLDPDNPLYQPDYAG